ncbi:MAG: ABC-F family ATP-binding cassette domain-containing protein [Clostridiales bacterium]|nr:ABC-F family ATP-binding cassette domain-containing protein [Clostridiales bacterium]
MIFENAGFKLYNARKTAVWGENGSGKTTLLNLICRQAAETGNITANINGALLPEDAIFSGEIKFVPKVSIGYFDQLLRNLDLNKTVIENVMQDCVQTPAVARSILARLLIRGDEVFKKTGVLSGGERIKVSFAKLLVSKSNLLILDEPTNHLDMDSVEALERVLGEYQGTLVFVTHDRTFANKLADDILVVEDRRIKHFEGTLEEYEAKIKDGASPKSKGMKAENQPDPSSVR